MFGVEHVYQTCIVVLLGNPTNGQEPIGRRPAFSWPTRSRVPRTKTCSRQSPIPEVYTRRSAKPVAHTDAMPFPGILFVVKIPDVSSRTHPALPCLRSKKPVTTWPSLCIDIRIANGQLSSEQMKAVVKSQMPKQGRGGCKGNRCRRAFQERAGLQRPVVLAMPNGLSPRLLTTSLQPSLHLRPPLWLLPRTFDLTAVPFAVAKDIGIQEKALQYTLKLSPPLFVYTGIVSQS